MNEAEWEVLVSRLKDAAADRRSARDRFDQSSEDLADLVRQASDDGMSNRQIRSLTQVAPESIRRWIAG